MFVHDIRIINLYDFTRKYDEIKRGETRSKQSRNCFQRFTDCRAIAFASFFSVNLSGSGSWQIAAVSDVSLVFDVTTVSR